MKKKEIYFIVFALLLINAGGFLNHLFGSTANPIIFFLCIFPGILGGGLGWISTSMLISKSVSEKKDLADFFRFPMKYKLYAGLPWLLLYYLIIFYIW